MYTDLVLGFMPLPFVVVLVGFAVCLLVVATQSLHGRLTLDGDEGVQKFHTRPTPRVGGLGLIAALGISAWLSTAEAGRMLLLLLLAGLPAFIAGFAEDLLKRVGVRERLLATMASGGLAWWLSGISLTRLDVPGLDAILALLPVSVLFTAFAVAGVANAVNIIDGFNGLASGVVMISLAALGAMAYLAGDVALAQVCLMLGAAMAGFLLVNYPFGRIFLGDGGAYLAGFCLGWVAVLLPMRNSSVSPWAVFLACSYPIIEVLFSVVRRRRRQLHPGHPDRLHLHSLIKCRVVRKQLPGWSRLAQNSAVAPIVWVFASVPALAAVAFRSNLPVLLGLALVFTVLYGMVYRHLARFRLRLPKRAGAVSVSRALTRRASVDAEPGLIILARPEPLSGSWMPAAPEPTPGVAPTVPKHTPSTALTSTSAPAPQATLDRA
jgi:UDP-N-acetylmuramyl pentapeptide phosphotransferase/UDP-N-acetylglucosamine-1-phosphate transferase